MSEAQESDARGPKPSQALQRANERLAEARRRGRPPEIAEALALHANALIQAGEIAAARRDLDEAAAIQAAAGRVTDEARCLQMSGALCRFQNAWDDAAARELRALELVGHKGAIAVSAYAELGEIEFARARPAESASQYRAALEASAAAGVNASVRAPLLRKRARALAAAKQYEEAVRDLESAFQILLEAGDRTNAAQALIEEATAVQQMGRFAEAEPVIRRAMDLAQTAGDHGALAEIHLLWATQALERRDAAAAMAEARAARTEALAGNAPTAYIGAAHAISQLAEAAGDRLGAYEALATGWATVAGLPHPSLARAAFEPVLKAMRERWGEAAFDQVKKNYEDARRQQMKAGESRG
jgi:tetratricopeptide (TPR) repeat protein